MTAPAPLVPAALDALDRAGFVALLGGVFEHSPWVAEAAWAARPFASRAALHRAMAAAVAAAPRERQLALLRAHPELAGQEAQAGRLTASSSGEQARLGFTALSAAELARVARANAAYRARFGFPCIVALALHATRVTVIAEMERRAAGDDMEAEIVAALEQVAAIARGRLERLVAAD